MLYIVIKRVLQIPLVVLGVSLVLFLISQVIPSDPVRLIAGDAVPPDVRANIIAKLGLDQPLHEQYGLYLQRLLSGDMGESIRFAAPVGRLLWEAFPATLMLVAASALLTVLIAFPLGFLAAKFRDTWVDLGARTFAMAGISTPSFYLALVMILVFSFYLGWFPISGRGEPPDLHHLFLPALVLALRDAGSSARLLRAGVLDAMGEDYVRSARARGLRESTILVKLAGRNALIPAITDMALRFAALGGQVILIETVFAWPGVGRLLHIGILWNDFPLVAGCIMILLTYVVLINLVVDILHRVIDPRLRT